VTFLQVTEQTCWAHQIIVEVFGTSRDHLSDGGADCRVEVGADQAPLAPEPVPGEVVADPVRGDVGDDSRAVLLSNSGRGIDRHVQVSLFITQKSACHILPKWVSSTQSILKEIKGVHNKSVLVFYPIRSKGNNITLDLPAESRFLLSTLEPWEY
jgi:hypothetical protein